MADEQANSQTPEERPGRDPIQAIATAPGDLPAPQIAARGEARQWQFRHDNITIPRAPAPGQPVVIYAVNGEALPVGRARMFYTTDRSQPTSQSASSPMFLERTEWASDGGYLTWWCAHMLGQPEGTIVRYRIGGWHHADDGSAEPDFWARDGQGFWFQVADQAAITTFAYRVEPPGQGIPSWVQDAVIYQIFLDRFHPGTRDGRFPRNTDPQGIHGGTLQGVRLALPYLDRLGVTCLWLSPICVSPSYHRYDATDFFTVDPRLGINDDLKALTAEAHALGMRVMLDFVPSHCSWEHPAFRAAQADPCAPTANWFTFEERPHRYRMFLDHVPSLPSFDTSDPGARAYLIESAIHWLNHGIDAFRLDHAIGPSMDFWVAFREATRVAKPEVYSVGEATDSPDCLQRYRHRLDAVLDFPLARAFRLTFATGGWTVRDLDNFLNVHERFMADGPGTLSFLDNHDMDRFLFLAGDDPARLKIAALCQFTLLPPPIVYYGSEIGLSQAMDFEAAGMGGDAEARRDMPWDESRWDHDLLAFYQALIRLHRQQGALRQGSRRTLHLDPEAGTYAYLRQTTGPDDQSILAVFNLSDQEQRITLPQPAAAVCLLATGPEPRIGAGPYLDMRLGPRSAAALAV